MKLSPVVLLFVVMHVPGSGTQCAAQSVDSGGDQSQQQTTATSENHAASSTETADRKAQSDLDRIQGLWHVVTLSSEQKYCCLFSGNKMYLDLGKRTPIWTFKLDATKNPKHFDLKFQDEQDQTVALRGIYQFKGDWLFIIFRERDSPRPAAIMKTRQGESAPMLLRGKQEVTTGIYTATVDGEEWTLNLDETGRVVVKKMGQVVVNGLFIATETELIVFPDEKKPVAGDKKTNTGRYKWKLNEKALSFTKIDDENTDRATAITASAWEKHE